VILLNSGYKIENSPKNGAITGFAVLLNAGEKVRNRFICRPINPGVGQESPRALEFTQLWHLFLE